MTVRYGLTDKMEMNVDMLGATVECKIFGETDSTLIITK